MTDFRYITALESNMELEHMIAQNESLRTSNKLLVTLAVLVVVGSVIAVWLVNESSKIKQVETTN